MKTYSIYFNDEKMTNLQEQSVSIERAVEIKDALDQVMPFITIREDKEGE